MADVGDIHAIAGHLNYLNSNRDRTREMGKYLMKLFRTGVSRRMRMGSGGAWILLLVTNE